MSQPEISPLARRLAEENNVDWRGLHGSGGGGKVVERDVLEYLARVMAGEEDLDPTPEPVPEGMEAWPEEDVESFQSDMRAATNGVGLQEIQQELSAADRLGQESAPLSTTPDLAPAMPSDDVSLVEGDDAGAVAEMGDAISEDIFLFEDDADGAMAPEFAAGGATDDSPAGFDAPADLAADDLLVAAEEASPVWDGTLQSEEAEDEALWVGASAAHDAEDDGSTLPDLFDDGSADESAQVADVAAGGEPFLGDAAADELEVASLGDVDADVASADEAQVWSPDAGEAVPEQASEDSAADDVPLIEEPPAPEPFAGADATADAPAVSEVAASTVTDHDEAAGPLPLVSYGTLLRRHVDVTALAGAQLAVGQEMGEGEPLSPASFLLRAAAKAVGDGGWGDGTIAMVALTPDGIRVGTIEGAANRPFVELARSLGAEMAQATESDTAAALAIADMSALEVDEAVLRLQAPLLTLGRILYDNQRGSYRSTLSLSGAVAPEAGARLLARVAELLDAPVRLLL